MNIFISYSSKDRDLIDILADELDALGYTIWYDRELNRRGGHQWWADIMQAIRDCDVFLYAASPNLIASEPCRREYRYAVALGKPIFPAKVVDVVIRNLPLEIQELQIFDARDLRPAAQRRAIRQSLDSQPLVPPLPVNARELEPEVPRDPIAVMINRIDQLTNDNEQQRLVLIAIEDLHDDGYAAEDVIEVLKRLIDRDDVMTGRNLKRAHDLLAKAQVGQNGSPAVTVIPEPIREPSRPIAKPVPPSEPTAGTIRRDAKGIEQVYVPAGQFMMGSDPAKDKDAQADEQPAHLVRITRAFWLDRYPVTNAAYQAFIDDGGYRNRALWTLEGWQWRNSDGANGAPATDWRGFSESDQPRIGVCWYEAMAYATWRGGRLPTEAEWEWAARGKDALIYPWGNLYELGAANINERSLNGAYLQKTTPVGSYPVNVSWCDVCDLSGNVWEWVADWYDEAHYQKNVQDDPTGPRNGSSPALRGGSWASGSLDSRTAYRNSDDPDSRLNFIGFRLAAGVAPVV